MGKNRWRFNDFEVNKSDEKAIIYRSATGNIIIRHKDIAAVKRGFTKKAFKKLKKISDEVYGEIYKSDHAEARRCFLTDDYSVYEDKAYITRTEKIISDKLSQQLDEAMELLTETQKRRFDMCFSSGMTLRKIAEQEKVDFKAVHRSVKAAQKKIQDYFISLGESSAFHR